MLSFKKYKVISFSKVQNYSETKEPIIVER